MAIATTELRLGAVTPGAVDPELEPELELELELEDEELDPVDELLSAGAVKEGAVAAASARARASRASSAWRLASSTFIRWISLRMDATSWRRSESCCWIDCFCAARS